MSSSKEIYYSNKYEDAEFEYRHVVLPKDLAKSVPRHKLMAEFEWRSIGVQQSRGWEHYMLHAPEPHILLFRRPRNYGTGNIGSTAPIQTTKITANY